MVELVDTEDLKSFGQRREGSSPFSGTRESEVIWNVSITYYGILEKKWRALDASAKLLSHHNPSAVRYAEN